MMALKDQTPEEKDAGLIRVGEIYQRTDHASAAIIVTLGDVAYQFADPRTLTHLILRHCSESHTVKSIREREE